MSTYLFVLKNDVDKTPWLARKWGNTIGSLAPCTYNSATNRLFTKGPNDKIIDSPCSVLTDEYGNKAAVVLVQIQ